MGNVNEKDFLQLDPYGNGVCIDRYKNELSLCLARKLPDGHIWKKWCFPQVAEKKPGDKAVPWRIEFGFKEQAIQQLEKLIYMIEGRSQGGY